MNINNLSVIVPTKNEAHNIQFLIKSIPPPVKLIVVDASEDDTASRCRALRPHNTIVIPSKAKIAEARNIGAQAAATDWILFTDADVTFAPEYFTQLKNLGPAHAFYGPKLAVGDHANYYRRFVNWQRRFHRFGIPAVSGSNLLVKTQTFRSAGQFNPGLLVNEDTEFGYRLKKRHFKIEFNPNLIVYARDHRRLVRGEVRKDLHSLARCVLIYLDIFPELWMRRDWGYWSK